MGKENDAILDAQNDPYLDLCIFIDFWYQCRLYPVKCPLYESTFSRLTALYIPKATTERDNMLVCKFVNDLMYVTLVY